MARATSPADPRAQPGPFRGFPDEALTFYAGLEADNSKTYWQAHKQTYDDAVRLPMEALLASLPDRYQPFHVFRPYRDVRFSKDKSPYKTMHGAASETEGGASHGLFVSRTGLFVGAGMYQMARDQIERFRASVAADATGSRLERIVDDLRGHKVRVYSGHDDPLTTAPRSYPRDHPRIELLRWKACIATVDIGSASVLQSVRVRRRILDMWEQSEPLLRWLEDNVGPSSAPR